MFDTKAETLAALNRIEGMVAGIGGAVSAAMDRFEAVTETLAGELRECRAERDELKRRLEEREADGD